LNIEIRIGRPPTPGPLYQNGSTTFVLVPGGAVQIGYEAGRPWDPNPDELESWRETAEEYGIAETIQEYIAEVTLRVRRVELSPFPLIQPRWNSDGRPSTLTIPKCRNSYANTGREET
jgi:hypothetical protein